jgi:hypothetical protein
LHLRLIVMVSTLRSEGTLENLHDYSFYRCSFIFGLVAVSRLLLRNERHADLQRVTFVVLGKWRQRLCVSDCL